MKAVVLAGGQEFGQCPLSRQAPRALWPLVDQPLIQHVLLALRDSGIGDMAISANGRTHDIARRLGDHPAAGITIHYSEDPLPRGAAGCIKDCEAWLGRDTFLVVSGASLMLDVDFAKLIDDHHRSQAVITVGVVDDSGGTLKPAGIYVCDPAVLSRIKSRGYQDVKEQLIPQLTASGMKVMAASLRGRVTPIRNEECYLNAMVDLMEDVDHRDRFTAHLHARMPTLWIDPSAYVHPTARVVGPVYIGPGTKVMQDAVVIGPAMIGADCQIEADALVHEAILWRNVSVGRSATVEQAVMGASARAAAATEVRGTIVLNADGATIDRTAAKPGVEAAAAQLPAGKWWRRVWGNVGPARPTA